MEDKGETRELDEVLDLFISSKEKSQETPSTDIGLPANGEAEEKEEKKVFPLIVTTNIRKEIACPAGPGAQERIRGLLFEYLQDDYEIGKIELHKVTHRSEAGEKIHQEEDICIVIKDH